jgi:glucosylceramidase
MRRACVVSAVLLAACASHAAPRDGDAPARGAVAWWVTTSDRAKLLHREADLSFDANVAAGDVTIDVDDAKTVQTMIGFGAAITDAAAHLIQTRLTATQRDTLLRELFGPSPGIGLSFVRVPMGASDFSLRHYSYDDVPVGERDPSLAHFDIAPDRAERLPLLRVARAINPRLTVVASPWSAPAWMKTSGSLIGGTLRDDAFDAYARYFVRFIEAYRAEGVRVHAITVQNEPNFEPPDYPGMRLEAPARARFIGAHVGPALARARLDTQIWDWDHNWDAPQSPLAVLADSAARSYVRGVAWHCYGGDVSAQSAVHDRFPDTDVYFTECSGGAWAPVWADNFRWTVGTLVIGASTHWARGVALWNLALDERGGPHAGGCGNCRGVLTIDSTGHVQRNEEYWALAHASRFVKPGAVRVSSLSGLPTVAFRNPDGSKALIVLAGAMSDQRVTVRWAGHAFHATLAAGSVATFLWS